MSGSVGGGQGAPQRQQGQRRQRGADQANLQAQVAQGGNRGGPQDQTARPGYGQNPRQGGGYGQPPDPTQGGGRRPFGASGQNDTPDSPGPQPQDTVRGPDPKAGGGSQTGDKQPYGLPGGRIKGGPQGGPPQPTSNDWMAQKAAADQAPPPQKVMNTMGSGGQTLPMGNPTPSPWGGPPTGGPVPLINGPFGQSQPGGPAQPAPGVMTGEGPAPAPGGNPGTAFGGLSDIGGTTMPVQQQGGGMTMGPTPNPQGPGYDKPWADNSPLPSQGKPQQGTGNTLGGNSSI